MQAEQRFSTENMPPEFDEAAKTWRKTSLTRAMRVEGPFIVETSEGPLRCGDGYLAVDARGYPYPIAADEFVQIYEEATGEQESDSDLRLAALDRAIGSLPAGVENWAITHRAEQFIEFLEKEKPNATAG